VLFIYRSLVRKHNAAGWPGPTKLLTSAALYGTPRPDFVKQDVKRLYPHLLPYVKITVVEAGPALLGPFDKALQDYVLRLFNKRDINVRLGTAVLDIEDYPGVSDDDNTVVKDGDDDAKTTAASSPFVFSPAKRAVLSDGTLLPFGTMVWSAGLAPRTFTEQLDPQQFAFRDPRSMKRLLVDDYLRVIGHEGRIWAAGDAAVNQSGVPLPQLAQVARQEGMYLAKVLSGRQKEDQKPFEFFSLGSMAFVGELKGVYDGSTAGTSWMPKALQGLSAFFLWRFAYWGRQTSITNKILIPMYWFKAFIFGRDTSRY
jgi:NADH dehydrogenase FAD-containing subunit